MRSLKGRAMGSSLILPCPCYNKFQDARYGKGQRVHNVGKRIGSDEGRKARCTACEDVKT
jgi:hypothetical protein